jgi:feruloyl esterase
MKWTVFPALLAIVASVRALLTCSIEAIGAILPANTTLLYAIPKGADSSFGSQSDIAYPLNATGLPAFCAVQVNVSQSDSSFVFALWLPVQWNQRLMTVGDGGYTGGVNYIAMGSSGLQYGFATLSTDTGTSAS